jgi:hypothetical protein
VKGKDEWQGIGRIRRERRMRHKGLEMAGSKANESFRENKWNGVQILNLNVSIMKNAVFWDVAPGLDSRRYQIF